MKTIKEELTALGERIKNEIIKNNYEIIEIGEHTCKIDVQGVLLDVWIANSIKDNFRVYNYVNEETSLSEYITFTSQKDRLKAYKKIRLQKKELMLSLKEKQIKELESKLKELKN